MNQSPGKTKLCGHCGTELVDAQTRVYRKTKLDGSPFFADVPVRKCPRCGEQWFSIETIRYLEAIQRGEVEPNGSVTVPVFATAA